MSVTHTRDAEIGRLLALLQERMECGIEGLIVTHGHTLALAMPLDGRSNAATWDWLSSRDWAAMRGEVGA